MNDTNIDSDYKGYVNNSNKNKKRYLDNDIFNFPDLYTLNNKVLSISFLGKNIEINQILKIDRNNGLRQNSFILIIGKKESTLS